MNGQTLQSGSCQLSQPEQGIDLNQNVMTFVLILQQRCDHLILLSIRSRDEGVFLKCLDSVGLENFHIL